MFGASKLGSPCSARNAATARSASVAAAGLSAGVQRGRHLGGEQERRWTQDRRSTRSLATLRHVVAGWLPRRCGGGRDDALRVLQHDAGTAAGDGRGHHDPFGVLKHDPRGHRRRFPWPR